MGQLHSEAISGEAEAAFHCNVDEVMLLAPTALAFSKCCLEFSAILTSSNSSIYGCWLQHAFLGDFMTGDLSPVKNN